jgi:phosphoglycolate phosphatase
MTAHSYDTIVFDLDGTLSDPGDGVANSLNAALVARGHSEYPASAVAALMGPPIEDILPMLTDIRDSEEITAIADSYRSFYPSLGVTCSVIYPGIREALQRLDDAGFTLGVCTSKRGDFAELILESAGLIRHFAFVSGGGGGVRKWQQLEALRAQGQVGDRSIMIGDRAVDLSAAHRNGLSSAGVLWGFGERAELETESPVDIFETPEEMVRKLLA